MPFHLRTRHALTPTQGPFRKPYGWAVWGLVSIVLSPFLVGSVATLVSLVGYEESVGGRGTVDGVAGMIQVGGQWVSQHPGCVVMSRC